MISQTFLKRLASSGVTVTRQATTNMTRSLSSIAGTGRLVSSLSTTTSMQPIPNTHTISKREYRGDAGEAEDKLSPEEEALLKIAKPKADEIYQKHIALPDDDDDSLNTRQKRLIYRSKQRGWLEVDLLLGTWASEHVPNLNGDELDQFEEFVNMETIDIYNVITLRLDVPDHMKRPDGNGLVEQIQTWARSSPLGKADPETYKTMKTDHKLI